MGLFSYKVGRQKENIVLNVYTHPRHALWETLLSRRDVEAIMFVIDSSDKLRLSVAKDELDELLKHQGEL